MKALVLASLLGCGHIPKADPSGVPPPWPPTPAPVKSEPPPPEENPSNKPLAPPLKTLPSTPSS